jgi:hypothetical protein
MNIKVIVSKVKLDKNAISKKALLDLCKAEMLNTSARLRSETGKGRNADGGSIKPGGYSESYKKAIEAGRVRGGSKRTGARKVSTSPVNLTITGDHLGSMQVRTVKDGAEIHFLGQHYSGLSNAQLAATLEARGFTGTFELGVVDQKRIETNFDKLVEDGIKKLVVLK